MRQARNRILVLVVAIMGAVPCWPGSAAALPSFQLTSASGGSNLPFTVGQAFSQGDVPSGSGVVGSISNLQVIPMNRWPDGSLKIAIVSGRATLSPNIPFTISLSVGSPSSGTALTTADLRATNVTASIGAGSFGTVSWSGSDFDSPFLTFVSGPQMSSWIYRKPVGSDAHLVGWLEVRLYAGGQVEVLPWIENGYLSVAGPTNKSATFTFALGGTQRFSQAINLLNHQRCVLAGPSAFSWWLGADPQVTPKHDVAYLQRTLITPMYMAVTGSNSSLWSRMDQTYTPLDQAGYPADMPGTGYAPSIGPLPEWDVAYLTGNADVRAYKAIVINGYCAGRYGIHFRDQTTNRPPSFASYPNLVLDGSSGVKDVGASSANSYTPTASGGKPPTWDTPHHPSIGFMAYLITGRFYFVEEAEFSATVGFLKQNDDYRQYTKGVLLTNAGTNTTRGAAWSLRTLAQAAAITPDSDPLHAQYVTSVEENVNFYYNLFIATPGNNPQGVCAPYSDYTPGVDPLLHSFWMEDFLTFAFAYAKDIAGVQASVRTKLITFMAWKYQSVVGRLGDGASTDYCYRDAANYTVAAAPSDNSKWTGPPYGPWYANWGQIYVATMGHANDCNTGTNLRGSSGGDPGDPAGYWGNLRPALAYAVDDGAAGAAAAYSRLTNASNYAPGATAMNDTPVWSVRPRTSGGSPGDTTPPSPPTNLQAR